MTEEEVLIEVIENFEALNIPYALTGGLAVSYYGRPRSTHDFDIVIQVVPGKNGPARILSAFNKDFYVSEEGVIDALAHETMFNIIHHETGLKIDLWILKNSAYDKEAFSRRKRVKTLGVEIFFLTAEDMILNKLLWHKASESEKHLKDVKVMYLVQKNNLDREYLKRWAINLSVADLLGEINRGD